ncbi:hypothetical protein [Pseudomonas sp. NPDC086566]|jgi:hypothetical protein|uniref:hypothetical protein n=1 Tax=Pseudomonas sp. NPDC086566 TaxID=3390647 RepID=UPI003D011815
MKADLPAREIPTDSEMPKPEVPMLSGGNLDLKSLGIDELPTYITYPGIELGQDVAPNFRGCADDGTPSDMLMAKQTIDDLDDQKRFLMLIPNGVLQPMKGGGQVFYSFYTVENDDLVAQSLRLFFTVDNEDQGGGAVELPVLQLQQSHELHVDLKALGSADAMLAVLPYQAMAEGDKVTFIYQAYFDGVDDPFVDWEFTEEVASEQVGQAILAVLPNSVLKSAEGLNGRMYYRIAYKDVADESTSPVQLNFPVREVLPAPDLLAPPVIKTLVGDALDPDDWPDGIFVQIPYHEDMLAGAGVVLYIEALPSSIQAIQLDPSSADSKRLEFHLSQQWLRDRRDQDISLSYQFGVVGKDGRSKSLELKVEADLKLAAASVKDATPDDTDPLLAEIGGDALFQGTEIILPSDQDLPPEPEFTVFWEGHETFSSTTPIGSSLRYMVPKAYMAANLGKTVKVHYDVKFGGGKPRQSPVLRLNIRDLDSMRWRTIETPGFGSAISRDAVDEAKGLPLLLKFWIFMEKGQNVSIEAVGKVEGVNKTFNIRDAVAVTEEEVKAEEITASFRKADLASFDFPSTFTINVRVSFDGGLSYKEFPNLTKRLLD